MNLTGIILNTSGCMDKSLFIKLKGKQNESMVSQPPGTGDVFYTDLEAD